MPDITSFGKAITLIRESRDVLITTHTRADGDACGSMAALCEALAAQGKRVSLLLVSPLPGWYGFLFDRKVPVLGNDISLDELKAGRFDDCELVIIVDTNSYSQLPNFSDWLKQAHKPILVIDHHVTSDGLGNVELIDTTAASTGQIVLELFRYANWPITPKVAEALFVALSTDTGWFRFANTDSRAFGAAAELVSAGALPADIYRRMYQSFSPARLKLMTAMLGTLELHLEGRLATQYILRQHFDQTRATGADTENLIDECQRISSVEAAALFVELKDGSFRCSLRSKGPVDVSKIAKKHGGGGHVMAAGMNLAGPLEQAIKVITDEVKSQLEA
jgi:phosphoesterase RecJ-like protein